MEYQRKVQTCESRWTSRACAAFLLCSSQFGIWTRHLALRDSESMCGRIRGTSEWQDDLEQVKSYIYKHLQLCRHIQRRNLLKTNTLAIYLFVKKTVNNCLMCERPLQCSAS